MIINDIANVTPFKSEEGAGSSRHIEIQFYSNSGLTRIWTGEEMPLTVIDTAIKYLNQSDLASSTYFPVKADKAIHYYNNSEAILIFCYHPVSKTGFWFTTKKRKGDHSISPMTDKMPDIDIRVNVLRGKSIDQFITDDSPFDFFYFVN